MRNAEGCCATAHRPMKTAGDSGLHVTNGVCVEVCMEVCKRLQRVQGKATASGEEKRVQERLGGKAIWTGFSQIG